MAAEAYVNVVAVLPVVAKDATRPAAPTRVLKPTGELCPRGAGRLGAFVEGFHQAVVNENGLELVSLKPVLQEGPLGCDREVVRVCPDHRAAALWRTTTP